MDDGIAMFVWCNEKLAIVDYIVWWGIFLELARARKFILVSGISPAMSAAKSPQSNGRDFRLGVTEV